MQGQNPSRATEDDDKDGEGKGEGGEGFGRPQLKPNLETLFDPNALLAESQEGGQGDASSGSAGLDVLRFGEWELRPTELMLYHSRRKKRLMLAQLDAPSKIMKVVVALSTQDASNASWDVESLLKALDHAAQKRFSRSLYQLVGLASDTAKLDWRTGHLGAAEAPRGPGGPL